MGLKPSVIEQTKFEYFPLGKIFKKGLNEDDKKEGHFERLENIKDASLTQLQAMKGQGEKQLKELKNIEESRTLEAIDKFRRKNDEAKDLVFKIKKIDTEIDTAQFVCAKTDGKTKYDFNLFTSPLKFVTKIHNYEMTLDEAIDDQGKLENSIIRLENYKPRKTKKIEEKNKVLESARKLLYVRNDIINAFSKKIFPYKNSESKTREEKSGEKSGYINNTFTLIEEKSEGINNDLLANYFTFSKPIDLAKQLHETKDAKKKQ